LLKLETVLLNSWSSVVWHSSSNVGRFGQD